MLRGVAFTPLPDRAFLRVSGPDATRWLNGMVTNSIQSLLPGEGNYNFFLNAQGRIQGDGTVYRDTLAGEATYLLETDTTQQAVLQQLLDRFIIMDDVEIAPGITGAEGAADSEAGLALLGPSSKDILAQVLAAREGGTSPITISPGHLLPARFQNQDILLMSPPVQTSSRYEIWCADRSALQALCEALEMQGIPHASAAAVESLRILEARPRYGTDIRNAESARDLPQETGQTQALHFAKGCYLGQEIVERIRSRGQVHRRFTPFRLEGALPDTFPVPLEVQGKTAGELTSGTSVETTDGPALIALGYGRREYLETGSTFSYAGGIAMPRTAGQLH